MIKTIGIIGAGMIGGQVARLSVAAGLNVIICNSRTPDTLISLIQELGSKARAATVSETINESDLVVAAIPLFAYKQLPVAELKGKIVIDTMNYYPSRDGNMAEVQTNKIASSEHFLRFLEGSIVVKTLNNMDFISLLNLARPKSDVERTAMPIACDNEAVAETVAGYLDIIGYDSVYIGTLAESWRAEPTMPAYVLPYRRSTAGGSLVSKKHLQELLSMAVRHAKMFGI